MLTNIFVLFCVLKLFQVLRQKTQKIFLTLSFFSISAPYLFWYILSMRREVFDDHKRNRSRGSSLFDANRCQLLTVKIIAIISRTQVS